MTKEVLLAFARASVPGTVIPVLREDLLALAEGENPDGRSEAREPRERSASREAPPYQPIAAWARERGISTKTARRWIKAGALPGARKLPGRGGWIIPRDAGTPVREATKSSTSCTVAPAPRPRARRPFPEEIAL